MGAASFVAPRDAGDPDVRQALGTCSRRRARACLSSSDIPRHLVHLPGCGILSNPETEQLLEHSIVSNLHKWTFHMLLSVDGPRKLAGMGRTQRCAVRTHAVDSTVSQPFTCDVVQAASLKQTSVSGWCLCYTVRQRYLC